METPPDDEYPEGDSTRSEAVLVPVDPDVELADAGREGCLTCRNEGGGVLVAVSSNLPSAPPAYGAGMRSREQQPSWAMGRFVSSICAQSLRLRSPSYITWTALAGNVPAANSEER